MTLNAPQKHGNSHRRSAVKEGVELIYNKFMSVLGQNGVKVIETKEQPLDTDYHEAIAVIPAPNEALKGKILDCVQNRLHPKRQSDPSCQSGSRRIT